MDVLSETTSSLRLELLTQFPNWLTQKATMLGCTSSHDILKMALKEIFPNEDATRFDLVEELYSFPQKTNRLPLCIPLQHGWKIGLLS